MLTSRWCFVSTRDTRTGMSDITLSKAREIATTARVLTPGVTRTRGRKRAKQVLRGGVSRVTCDLLIVIPDVAVALFSAWYARCHVGGLADDIMYTHSIDHTTWQSSIPKTRTNDRLHVRTINHRCPRVGPPHQFHRLHHRTSAQA